MVREDKFKQNIYVKYFQLSEDVNTNKQNMYVEYFQLSEDVNTNKSNKVLNSEQKMAYNLIWFSTNKVENY